MICILNRLPGLVSGKAKKAKTALQKPVSSVPYNYTILRLISELI